MSSIEIEREQSVFVEFVQALEGFVALALVYNFAAHTINSVAVALSIPPILVTVFEWGSLFGDMVLVCIATGFITWVVLKYVCESDWVKEKVKIKECWKEKKWYNPWHWVKVLVCTVKEVFKWVLKQICKWKEVIITILILTCVLAVVAIAA